MEKKERCDTTKKSIFLYILIRRVEKRLGRNHATRPVPQSSRMRFPINANYRTNCFQKCVINVQDEMFCLRRGDFNNRRGKNMFTSYLSPLRNSAYVIKFFGNTSTLRFFDSHASKMSVDSFLKSVMCSRYLIPKHTRETYRSNDCPPFFFY